MINYLLKTYYNLLLRYDLAYVIPYSWNNQTAILVVTSKYVPVIQSKWQISDCRYTTNQKQTVKIIDRKVQLTIDPVTTINNPKALLRSSYEYAHTYLALTKKQVLRDLSGKRYEYAQAIKL